MIRKQKGKREIMGHTHHHMSCLKVKENQPKKRKKKIEQKLSPTILYGLLQLNMGRRREENALS